MEKTVTVNEMITLIDTEALKFEITKKNTNGESIVDYYLFDKHNNKIRVLISSKDWIKHKQESQQLLKKLNLYFDKWIKKIEPRSYDKGMRFLFDK